MGSCVRNKRGFVAGTASAGRFVSSGAGMVTQGSVPSPAVLLRASPDLGQGHWFLPSLGEVLAADPVCLSTALPGGLGTAGGRAPLVSQVQQPCVLWPEAVCALCNVLSPWEWPQGKWGRAVMDQDGSVTLSGALRRNVSWGDFSRAGLSRTA